MPKRCFGIRALRRLLLVAACCGIESIAWAQTQDAFFSDDTVQEVRLAISSRDWQTLKDKADENTYYPADLTWNAGRRDRNPLARITFKPSECRCSMAGISPKTT